MRALLPCEAALPAGLISFSTASHASMRIALAPIRKSALLSRRTRQCIAIIADMRLYDGDEESRLGVPVQVERLKEEIASAHARHAETRLLRRLTHIGMFSFHLDGPAGTRSQDALLRCFGLKRGEPHSLKQTR